MGSQQRRRDASFSITIPISLLSDVNAAAAAGYRSRTALLERQIIEARTLYIESRIDGVDFEDLTRLGRWLRLEITEGRIVRGSESSVILDRLSSIKIAPRATQPRRTQPVELTSPTQTLAVRTLPAIKAKATANAKAANLSLSAYCLRLLTGQPVYPKPSTDDARIASEIGKISGLLILADCDHADLFIDRDHHRQATQIVNGLLQQWRRG